MTVRAIFENGVFKPTGPVDLPEKAKVVFEPQMLDETDDDLRAQQQIYALLQQSIPSGESDVAERHNEHQP